MSPKAQKIIIGVFLVLCVLSGGVFLLKDCGPSEEDIRTVRAVNRHAEILERGGHVEHIKFLHSKQEYLDYLENYQDLSERRKERIMRRIERSETDRKQDKDMPFWADILDDSGNTIGQVSGFRVEGFGVARADCHWFGEEEDEEEDGPRPRGRRGRRWGRPPDGITLLPQ